MTNIHIENTGALSTVVVEEDKTLSLTLFGIIQSGTSPVARADVGRSTALAGGSRGRVVLLVIILVILDRKSVV